MLFSLDRDISIFVALIRKALERICIDFGLGEIANEDDFTSQMIHAMKAIASQPIIPFAANVKYIKLRSSGGSGAEEARIGADILLLLKVDFPGYKARKSLLLQAKILEDFTLMSESEWSRLRKQCEKMLSHTIESYALFYSTSGIKAVRAHGILGLDEPDPWLLSLSGMDWLLYHFFTCRLGDPLFAGGGEPRLEMIAREFNIRHAVEVSLAEKETRPLEGMEMAPL